MYQDLVARIAVLTRKYYHDDLPPPATEEALQRLRRRTREELGVEVPEGYLDFLRVANGLNWDGLFIYASDRQPFAEKQEVAMHSFVEDNLGWRDYEPHSNYLVFADGDISLYALNLITGRYELQDRPSGTVIETYDTFEAMIVAALTESLHEDEAVLDDDKDDAPAAIDNAAVLAAIDRCRRIEWRQDTSRLGSHVALIREYLRRSAVVAEALKETVNWPWNDVAARLTLPGINRRFLPGYVFLDKEPVYEGPEADPLEDKVIALNAHINENRYPIGWYGRHACWWYIRWASVKNHPALVPLNLPDPYEPLIVFYERGGWLRPEQGYIDLNGANVTIAGWQKAANQTPLPTLDSAALDLLDTPEPDA